MTIELTAEHVNDAYRLGVDAALANASWFTPSEGLAAYLIADDDIDPRWEDELPAEPNLSGEYADGATPHALAQDVLGRDYDDTYDPLAVDALSDAWEEGRDAVWREALLAVAYRSTGDIGAALELERRCETIAEDGRAERDGVGQDLDTRRAMTFGGLVKRTAGVVDHYQSDFYRDVQWLMHHMEDGPFTFYYSASDHGTAIGTDRELVTLHRGLTNAYRVQVRSNTRGTRWWATYLPLADENDSYRVRVLSDVRAAGPAAGEDFYRLQASGAHTGHHINISASQLDALIRLARGWGEDS